MKVHYEEETRLTVITPGIGFNEFTYKLKMKLGMERACKFKVRDEDGEQILVADQEDLDLQLSACKRAAKRAKSETGKLSHDTPFFRVGLGQQARSVGFVSICNPYYLPP